METAQLLLVIIVCLLGLLLILLGIQVFFILKEFQRSVKKINKILDDAGIISESFAKPISSLSSSLGTLSGLIGALGLFLGKIKKDHQDEEEENGTEK